MRQQQSSGATEVKDTQPIRLLIELGAAHNAGSKDLPLGNASAALPGEVCAWLQIPPNLTPSPHTGENTLQPLSNSPVYTSMTYYTQTVYVISALGLCSVFFSSPILMAHGARPVER